MELRGEPDGQGDDGLGGRTTVTPVWCPPELLLIIAGAAPGFLPCAGGDAADGAPGQRSGHSRRRAQKPLSLGPSGRGGAGRGGGRECRAPRRAAAFPPRPARVLGQRAVSRAGPRPPGWGAAGAAPVREQAGQRRRPHQPQEQPRLEPVRRGAAGGRGRRPLGTRCDRGAERGGPPPRSACSGRRRTAAPGGRPPHPPCRSRTTPPARRARPGRPCPPPGPPRAPAGRGPRRPGSATPPRPPRRGRPPPRPGDWWRRPGAARPGWPPGRWPRAPRPAPTSPGRARRRASAGRRRRRPRSPARRPPRRQRRRRGRWSAGRWRPGRRRPRPPPRRGRSRRR